MNSKSFGTMDLANLTLAVVVTALVGLGWGRPGAVAGGVGALLACINLWVIRRLAARAVARAAAGDKAQASWLMAALGAKMMILFGLVWLCHPRLQSGPRAIRNRNIGSANLAGLRRAVDRVHGRRAGESIEHGSTLHLVQLLFRV